MNGINVILAVINLISGLATLNLVSQITFSKLQHVQTPIFFKIETFIRISVFFTFVWPAVGGPKTPVYIYIYTYMGGLVLSIAPLFADCVKTVHHGGHDGSGHLLDAEHGASLLVWPGNVRTVCSAHCSREDAALLV